MPSRFSMQTGSSLLFDGASRLLAGDFPLPAPPDAPPAHLARRAPPPPLTHACCLMQCTACRHASPRRVLPPLASPVLSHASACRLACSPPRMQPTSRAATASRRAAARLAAQRHSSAPRAPIHDARRRPFARESTPPRWELPSCGVPILTRRAPAHAAQLRGRRIAHARSKHTACCFYVQLCAVRTFATRRYGFHSPPPSFPLACVRPPAPSWSGCCCRRRRASLRR